MQESSKLPHLKDLFDGLLWSLKPDQQLIDASLFDRKILQGFCQKSSR